MLSSVACSFYLYNNFQIKTHNFKFTKHVSDDRHPSSVVNTSEPLVGVILHGKKFTIQNLEFPRLGPLSVLVKEDRVNDRHHF